MSRNFAPIAVLTGTMLVVCTASFAAPSPTKAQDDSARAERLLKSVAADARQIQLAGVRLEKLSKDSTATWRQYDRQWNELQPAVETMHRTIARLEAIGSSLSASEKRALDQSNTDYQKIAWQSSELGKLMDHVPADLNTSKFKIESRNMVKEAADAVKAAKTGI